MKDKLLNWGKSILAAVLGVGQAFLKLLKEIATGLIDVVSLLIPFSVSQAIVEKIREVFNSIDNFIEIWKEQLLEEIV